MKLSLYTKALKSGEDYLLRRLDAYAFKSEYAFYIRTREEEWRLILRESVRALIEYLQLNDALDPLPASEKITESSAAVCGAKQAQRQWHPDVRFDMSLGLAKFVRQAFIDLIDETPLTENESKQALAITHQFFDKFELGFCSELVRYRETILAKDKERFQALEAQLYQAQKLEAIGTLAGGIVHDLNNTLFPIIGYTEMAMEDVPEESSARKNMQEVIKAAQRAKELAQQVLLISREHVQERKPLKIKLIIKEALKLIRSALPTTIKIHQNIESDCGWVLADPTQIHQIIMNLFTNAYHAMEKTGGVLKVGLRNLEPGLENIPSGIQKSMFLKSSKVQESKTGSGAGPYVCLTVSDTGHGMEPDVMEQIFDPNYTTKDSDKGTGLGLAVVYRIVKSYGGEITATSEPGKGTEFNIYLPRINEGADRLEYVSCVSVPRGKERILVIDDEKQIAGMIKQMLAGLGYQVTAQTSSIDALAIFSSQPQDFDLVITDQTMPDMTGEQLAREMMQIRSDMPVILCSGHSYTESKDKAAAIREYIQKPVVKKDLAGAVRKALDAEPTI